MYFNEGLNRSNVCEHLYEFHHQDKLKLGMFSFGFLCVLLFFVKFNTNLNPKFF